MINSTISDAARGARFLNADLGDFFLGSLMDTPESMRNPFLVPYSLSLWHHSSLKITFCLCVNDFGIKYYSRPDALHLLNSLKKTYPVTIDSQISSKK